MNDASSSEPLTDNEGSLLGVVMRRQPVTTYQLLKIYEASPVTSFNQSKGGLYKTVRRLRSRGLLASEALDDDGRNTEILSCTNAGREMLRDWVKALRPAHTLTYDPLRTRLLSLDLLDREEQIEWIVDAKTLLEAKLAEVDAYDATVSVPFQDIVHLSSIQSLRGKIFWLDRLLIAVVKHEGARGTSTDPDPPAGTDF